MHWGTKNPEYPATLSQFPWNFVIDDAKPKHGYVQQAASAKYGPLGDTLFQYIQY